MHVVNLPYSKAVCEQFGKMSKIGKIGSGDLGQFSDRASYSDRLMFSCMRRRTRYESHTTLSAPLRSLVPFSSPPSIPFSFFLFFVFTPNSRLVSDFVALLSGVRVCHLEVTSTPGFVSFVNSVNELFVTFRHNLGSQLFASPITVGDELRLSRS